MDGLGCAYRRCRLTRYGTTPPPLLLLLPSPPCMSMHAGGMGGCRQGGGEPTLPPPASQRAGDPARSEAGGKDDALMDEGWIVRARHPPS